MTRRAILIDENLPVGLRLLLPSVNAMTVEFMGWKGMRNGELVRQAQDRNFAAILTADRALPLTPHAWAPMGCILLATNRLAALEEIAARLDQACINVRPGQMLTVKV